MKVLSIAEMLATKLRTEYVPVPEWASDDDDPSQCFVKIRELTADERIAMAQRMTNDNLKIDPKKIGEFAPFLLSAAIVDESGEGICSEEDARGLQSRSSFVVNRIALAVSKLSGLNRQAQTETAKN